LAHISPAEAQLLHDVTDGGSINPATGLPEFFFGDFFGGLSDSFSSIGTSLSDSFSSFGDSMSSFSDSFSSGLSDFGDNFSSGLNDTFGDDFSDKFGGVAGNLTSQLAGDYVSKKVGGEFGSLLGNTVGSTLGNTVSGAFSSPDTSNQPKSASAGLEGNANAAAAPAPKRSPQIDLNPKSGQTHVGAAQQARNLKIMKQQEAPQRQEPQKPPLTLNQKIESVTKKMNADRIVEQKAKIPASQQKIQNELIAKFKPQKPTVTTQEPTIAVTQQVTPIPKTESPISDERIGKEIEVIKAENPKARRSYNELKGKAINRLKAKDMVAQEIPTAPFEGKIPDVSKRPERGLEDEARKIYRGIVPPELRQQLEGLGQGGKITLETLSPGADVKDMLNASGKTTQSLLDGDLTGAAGHATEMGAAAVSIALPGSVSGAKKIISKASDKIGDATKASRAAETGLKESVALVNKHRQKSFGKDYSSWWDMTGKKLDAERKANPNRKIAKGESFIWGELQKGKKSAKYKTNGLDGKKERLFTFDRGGNGRHRSEIEVWNGQGKHLGTIDPLNGQWLQKTGDANKSIDVSFLYDTSTQHA